MGIELPDAVQEVAAVIAARVGRQVELRPIPQFPAFEGARIENGVPVVVLRDPDGITAYNAAHGILHLRCEILGYPRTVTRADAADPKLISQVLGELGSLVEHRVIYPELRAYGFDPAHETEHIIRSGLVPKLNDPSQLEVMPAWPRKLWLILKYTRCRLELPKGPVLEAVESAYRDRYRPEWRDGLTLVSTIRSIDVRDVSNFRKVLLAAVRQLGCPEPETWIGVSPFAGMPTKRADG